MYYFKQQLELVREDVRNLAFIEKPFYDVQKEAVAINPKAIALIENPLPSIQLLAVESDPTVIRLIHDPHKRAVLTAIYLDESLVRYLDEVTIKKCRVTLNRKISRAFNNTEISEKERASKIKIYATILERLY